MTQDPLDLSGKRILITGACGGIGLATAEILAAQGADLRLTDLALSPAGAALLDRHQTPGRADFVAADLSREADLDALDLDGIDALVCLNGIFPTADWLSDDDWRTTFGRVVDVNLTATLALLRRALPRMASAGRGQVVLVGSTAGRTGGNPDYVQPHYTATKAGLHAITYNLAKRFARDGVRVNGVAPGAVDTAMNTGLPRSDASLPLGRMGRAEEVAWPIAFMCSSRASYMSGTVLDVNGGLYMH